MDKEKRNIRPTDTKVAWNNTDVPASLASLFDYVIAEARRSELWYWDKKGLKAVGSQTVRFLAISLAALGGIFPIVAKLGLFPGVRGFLHDCGILGSIEPGLWSSFFIASAAALLGLDRAFGLSSGWARYVLAGTMIRRASQEFRMDWTALEAQLEQPPQAAQITAMIQRAKDFRLVVESLLLKETQDWVTEFQNNIAQVEKDLKVHVDRLKAERDKAADAEALASVKGSIEATIDNADKTDNYRFDVKLESQKSIVASESVARSKSWAGLGIAAGQYKLTIAANGGGKPFQQVAIVHVKPGETTKVTLALPV